MAHHNSVKYNTYNKLSRRINLFPQGAVATDLERASDYNLVQFGENVQEKVNFICYCCGCCCDALIAARKFGFLNPVHNNQVMFSHRALAAILGVILKLPPVKQAVASQQFKSRYLASLIRRQKIS
jgi:hypothetical protein